MNMAGFGSFGRIWLSDSRASDPLGFSGDSWRIFGPFNGKSREAIFAKGEARPQELRPGFRTYY